MTVSDTAPTVVGQCGSSPHNRGHATDQPADDRVLARRRGSRRLPRRPHPARPGLGAEETGASVYDIPPGQSICPYHYEWASEEWLFVIEGEPILRDPEGEHALQPGDLIFFPKRPDGAHKVTNRTDERVHVLMFSTIKEPGVSVYPDSDKIGVHTGGDGRDDIMVRRESGGVGYFEGEV